MTKVFLNSGLVGSLFISIFPFVVHIYISEKYGRTGWFPDRGLMENFLKFICLYVFSPESLLQATGVHRICNGSSTSSCQQSSTDCKPSSPFERGKNASFI